MAFPFPCCPVNRECHVKENPHKKINELVSIRLKDFFGENEQNRSLFRFTKDKIK